MTVPAIKADWIMVKFYDSYCHTADSIKVKFYDSYCHTADWITIKFMTVTAIQLIG